MVELSHVSELINAVGLTPRGAFHPGHDDGLPVMSDGRRVATVVLVGNAGPRMWQRFSTERDPAGDLLDDWSRETITQIAEQVGARALFPFDRPYLPFQRWAQRAEPVHVSPLGVLIHPRYGLWHGYRGAIAFAETIALPVKEDLPSPCLTCQDRPCLTTCPVGAFTDAGYDVPACAGFLAGSEGRDCMDCGCAARRACPVGRAFVYEAAQAEFHMTAFLNSR